MTALIWRALPTSDGECATLTDGRAYVVDRSYAERGFWDLVLIEGGVKKPLGCVLTKKIAKAFCQDHWGRTEPAAPQTQPVRARFDEPDVYALEPFEPTGDEEWDRRARGGVETDGL